MDDQLETPTAAAADAVAATRPTEVRGTSARGRYVERLRRLAELWPSLDDDDRAQLEVHLRQLRQKAAAS